MLKGAICFFALSIILFGCTTQMAHPPLSLPSPPTPQAPTELTVAETTESEGKAEAIEKSEVRVEISQKEEVKEKEKIEETKILREEVLKDLSQEVAHLKPPPEPPKLEVPEAPPLLPDLTITNLFLNPRKRLGVTIANIGNSPLPMSLGNLKVFLDGELKESYGLNIFSDQPSLQPNEDITFTTPLILRGRREVKAYVETNQAIKETNQKNNSLDRILEGLPIGPDLAIKGLDLTEDFELSIIFSNAGEVDLRKGAIFRVRIFVNNLKISDFDHFISDVLKGNSGNDYALQPPYRVGISGTAKVEASISPRQPSDDIYFENNTFERTFIIFPFRILPQEKKEFSFTVSSSHVRDDGPSEKLKAELRWEGEETSLMFSLTDQEHIQGIPTFSGKSPLKVEIPIHFLKIQKKSLWQVFVTNLIEKKVEGHLIIQHP